MCIHIHVYPHLYIIFIDLAVSSLLRHTGPLQHHMGSLVGVHGLSSCGLVANSLSLGHKIPETENPGRMQSAGVAKSQTRLTTCMDM